ncbi:MAG: SusC/RagA family TonB-linked outer membrane protein [Gemmatimonadaceae bacterium]
MHTRTLTWARWASAIAVFLSASMVQAQAGTIAVRVTDAASQNPIDQAQVSIVGTNLGGLTNSEGRAVIRGVNAGTHQLRVLRVGYAEQKKPVTVAAGQQATAEFALGAVAVSLAPVVTTATGESRRVELGNAIAQIDVAKTIEIAPVKTVDDLLTSRTSGIAVTTGTQTGSGSRIRIRGSNSLSLSNEPLWVIDGVRMTDNISSSNLFTGGAQPSRVGDLNPDEIESIEIVKGPSAASLYGTAAANGVIVVTTKRGRAGQARWTVYGEGGYIEDQNTYPTAYTIFGKRVINGVPQTTPAPGNFCNLQRVSLGECTVDSVARLNLWADPDLTPLGTGNRSQYGLQLSGGSDVLRYFVSGEREDETGLLELPPFERRRLDSTRTVIRDYTNRPNVLAKNSFRANLNATLNPKIDLALTTAYINLGQRFSLESNATAGLGSQAFGGPGCKICSPDRLVGGGLGTPLFGYRAWTPGYTWQQKSEQTLNRFIATMNADWRPTTWLQNRLTFGNDFSDRVDDNFLFNGEGPPITGIYRNGFKDNTRTDIRNLTANLGSTATWNARDWLNLRTTAGVQYVSYTFEQNIASGTEIPPGAQTPNVAITRTGSEFTTLQKTLGIFIEEAAAINDRLFLTAALRSDQNSAFGTDFQSVLYPKASLSWILSQEEFFPKIGILDHFRLLFAYGSSGVQPGPNDALRFFAGVNANIRGADQPTVVFSSIGNNTLKPERSTEWESSFESKWFSNRYSLDVAYYSKRTKDALISAIVPPSAGSAASVRRNLGAVRNQGWELVASGQILDKRPIAIDLSINASTNSNKLLSLGGTPPQVGVSTRVVEGYPLFGFWARRISGWQDKNGDGLLTYSDNAAVNELFVDDSASFRGYTQPRHLVTLTSGFDFFNRRVRLQSLFDYRGGHRWYNNTERIRCASRQNCAGRMDPNAPLEVQATVLAHMEHPSRTLDGFFEKGDYVRWRELSVQYALTPDLAQRLLRARSGSVVLSARNLQKWTGYRGVDPEADFVSGESSDTPAEFQTVGPPTFFTLRLNLTF